MGGAEAPGGGIGESRTTSTETRACTEVYSGSKKTPKLSLGEGGRESRSYSGGKDAGLSGGDGSGSGESRSNSTQSSVRTEGSYSTQESGDPTDEDSKILLEEGSIGVSTAKRIRRESSKLDHGGAGGAGPWRGDGEGVDAGGKGEVEKRPFQRQVSKGKGDHIFAVLVEGPPDWQTPSVG